jgi:hypothetical protein
MAAEAKESCDFLGWALIDLDDPNPKRAYKLAHRLGVHVEEIIDEAIKEKMDRMGEP